MPAVTLAAARAAPADVDEEALAAHALRIATRTAMGVLADREAAADVAQEVALIALRKRGALRDPAKLDAWLHRTATRAALREAGRGRTRAAAEQAAARPDRTHDEHAAALAAAQMLAALPPRQRAALTLRYVHDLDDRAIAAALGCRRGTVRSLLSRGLAALRTEEGTR